GCRGRRSFDHRLIGESLARLRGPRHSSGALLCHLERSERSHRRFSCRVCCEGDEVLRCAQGDSSLSNPTIRPTRCVSERVPLLTSCNLLYMRHSLLGDRTWTLQKNRSYRIFLSSPGDVTA